MDLNWIADPTAESVLDLLVRDEPPTQEEREATARCRAARVRRQLGELAGVLNDAKWDQHTTGVALVRLLARLVDESAATAGGPTALQEFVAETFDGKTNAFRPHRVSQFVKARHGVGITNHTVKKMLGLLADAGRGAAADGGPDAGADYPAGHRRSRRMRAAVVGGGKQGGSAGRTRSSLLSGSQPSVRLAQPESTDTINPAVFAPRRDRSLRRPVRLPRLRRAVRSGRR